MTKVIWLIKFEEDICFDQDPYPHRTLLMSHLLAQHYNVVRFCSKLDHKRQRIRKIKSKLNDQKTGISYRFLPFIINYKNSKFLRILSHYINAVQLLFLLLFQKTKPDLIIVSMPQPINVFVSHIYKNLSSRKTKIIIDTRDLWPEILILESKNVFINLLSFL